MHAIRPECVYWEADSSVLQQQHTGKSSALDGTGAVLLRYRKQLHRLHCLACMAGTHMATMNTTSHTEQNIMTIIMHVPKATLVHASKRKHVRTCSLVGCVQSTTQSSHLHCCISNQQYGCPIFAAHMQLLGNHRCMPGRAGHPNSLSDSCGWHAIHMKCTVYEVGQGLRSQWLHGWELLVCITELCCVRKYNMQGCALPRRLSHEIEKADLGFQR